MSVVSAHPNAAVQRFVFESVSWDRFIAMTDALGEQSARVSYNGSQLEIMTTSLRHQRWKKRIARLVEMLTLETGMELVCGGEMTFRNEQALRGLEPDECYWIQNAETMLPVQDWDALIHPAPDLAIEIDVSPHAVDREEIYAQLGVAEIWRFRDERLSAWGLTNGRFEPIEFSRAFPFLRVTDLQRFIEPAGDTATLREFVSWIREQGFPSAE